MKKYYKKIKKFIFNRLLDPVTFRTEKNAKIAKLHALNKSIYKYNKLWVNGLNINKQVLHIKKQEQLDEFVMGLLTLDRNIIYLCNSNIILKAKDFNTEFELIETDTNWSVVNIHENISPESEIKFDFSNNPKIPYYWIAKPGFCNFNKINESTKLSTNYRSSESDYFSFE
ncbi:hypothetical protein D8X55_01235 [Malacoplasma penetrans]|nr:hypothetical protein [Malacoplasma penetrans]RXY97084.1 hypothetical protein D8X55_01235 [Malacoplasma penetrans]